MPEQILELFPLQELPPRPANHTSTESSAERLRLVQDSLIVQKPVFDDEDGKSGHVTRPGELYRRYRTVEELPENAKPFYNKAGRSSPPLLPERKSNLWIARSIGITLPGLVRAVFQTEVRLESWNLAERKRNLMGDG